MPKPVAAVLALLVLAAGPAFAETVERVTIKGAHAYIRVPDDWNGGLFLYAHGYSADERLLVPIPDDLLQANQVLLPGLLPLFVPPGYASAMTTFRSVGWYVKDAVKDIENLRRYFVKKYGKPKRTYLWGHSGGGMVTQTVIEYFPGTYDGAAPMCGPGAGGRRNFDGAFDLRVLFEYVCEEVPEARFTCGVCTDGVSRCVRDEDCGAGGACSGTETPPAPEDGLTPECTAFLLAHPERFDEGSGGDFVTRPMTACFGGESPSPDQAARKDLFLRVSRIPEGSLASVLFFASVGIGEIVHRRTDGRHPWGNVGVEYASPLISAGEQALLNDRIYRADSDAAAVRYMRRFYEPRGKTQAKVVTVHALDDGLVIAENATKYAQAFEASRRSDQLVQFFTPTGGHCLFLSAWGPALQALVGWVERGEKPTAAAMNAACAGCLTDETPGPWGLRVVEREQKGAPVRARICTGEPGDCPSGASCSATRRRCQ